MSYNNKNSSIDYEFLANRSVLEGLRRIPKYITLGAVSNGILGAIFFLTCVVMIVNGGTEAGLTSEETISWVFSTFVFGSLLGFYLQLKYKMPIVGAWSMPAVTVASLGFQLYSLPEMRGAFIMSGILVFVLGATGLIKTVMKFLPMPMVMAMLAGALVRYCTNTVSYVSEMPLIIFATIITFLVCTKYKEIVKLPPVLITFCVTMILAVATGVLETSPTTQSYGLVIPQFGAVAFNLSTIPSVVIPTTLLVIGVENAQAIGLLKSRGYPDVPVTVMTVGSGFGGVIAGLLGGHNANIAGPTTGICSAPEVGPLETRYTAAFVCNVITLFAGLFAGVMVPFILLLPSSLITPIAALALLRVMMEAFQVGFGTGKMPVSCFFTFGVCLANKSFFNIGPVFWGLLVGVIVALFLEKDEFTELIRAEEEKEKENKQHAEKARVYSASPS